ncbi:MAG: hypothetical protein GY940_21015 [bacterium]|nr:hypothetical protein [bacterium]
MEIKVNNVKIIPYDLPDASLLNSQTPGYRWITWEPQFLSVVLGQSNKPEKALHQGHVASDNVPVYKRPSGGESVVLSPKTLVISILKQGDPLRSPKLYFKEYNSIIIHALASLGIQDLRERGISDICIGEQEILGSSIYRNKNMVLYHAVLNRAESTDTFERYLKHPTKEPGYRQGRSHREFVTSLEETGCLLTGPGIKDILDRYFRENLGTGNRLDH